MMNTYACRQQIVLNEINNAILHLPFYSLLPDDKLMSSDWTAEKQSCFCFLKDTVSNFIKNYFTDNYSETVEEIFQPYIEGDYDKLYNLNFKEKRVKLTTEYLSLLNYLKTFPHLLCRVKSDRLFKKTQFLEITFGNDIFEMVLLKVRITKR